MDGNNNTFAQAAANDSGLHLNPAAEAGLTKEQIENPQTGREYYLDTLSAVLQENIGNPVTCEFLIGTNNIVRRDGVLYAAGVNFVTLYQPNEGRYVVCDVFSLRFVTFYEPRGRNTTMNFNTQGRQASGGSAMQNSNSMQNNMSGAYPNMMPNGTPNGRGGF